MNIFRLGIVAVTAAAFMTASAAAPTPVGKWAGKISMDMSSLPKAKDAQTQAMMDQQLAIMKKVVVNLALKADKTYVMTMSGIPTAPPKPNTGTWSAKGNVITMKMTPLKGGPIPPLQTVNMAADGKTMKLIFPTGGPKGSIAFTKVK